jgi:hypothetical protein
MIAWMGARPRLLLAVVVLGLVLRLVPMALTYPAGPIETPLAPSLKADGPSTMSETPVLAYHVARAAMDGMTSALKPKAPLRPKTALALGRLPGLPVMLVALLVLVALLRNWPDQGIGRHALAIAAVAVLHPASLLAGGIGSAASFISVGVLLAVLVIKANMDGRLGRGAALALLVVDVLVLMPPIDGALIVGLMLAVTVFKPHKRRDLGPAGMGWMVALGVVYAFRAPLFESLQRLLPSSAQALPRLASPLSASLASWGVIARGLFGLRDVAVRLPLEWALAAAAVAVLTLAAALSGREAVGAGFARLRGLGDDTSDRALRRVGWAFLCLWFLASAPKAAVTAATLTLGKAQPALDTATSTSAQWLAMLGLAGLVLVAIASGAAGAAWEKAREALSRVHELDLAVLAAAAYLGLVRAPVGCAGWAWLAGVASLVVVYRVFAVRIGERAGAILLRSAAVLAGAQTSIALWGPASAAARVTAYLALAMTALVVLVVFVDTSTARMGAREQGSERASESGA